MKRTNSILTLANGHHVDLLGPKSSDVDFDVIGEHLAKENRYNGATPDVCYSVAEHSVRAALAALYSGATDDLAAYVLIHDCHEAFLKDDTTPKKSAIGVIAEEAFGVLASTITDAFDRLTDRFDAAIHEAAGLQWPPSREIAGAIKYWDLRMFATEWRDLMRNCPHPDPEAYKDVQPLPFTITPWPWTMACGEFRAQCRRLLPTLKGFAA